MLEPVPSQRLGISQVVTSLSKSNTPAAFGSCCGALSKSELSDQRRTESSYFSGVDKADAVTSPQKLTTFAAKPDGVDITNAAISERPHQHETAPDLRPPIWSTVTNEPMYAASAPDSILASTHELWSQLCDVPEAIAPVSYWDSHAYQGFGLSYSDLLQQTEHATEPTDNHLEVLQTEHNYQQQPLEAVCATTPYEDNDYRSCNPFYMGDQQLSHPLGPTFDATSAQNDGPDLTADRGQKRPFSEMVDSNEIGCQTIHYPSDPDAIGFAYTSLTEPERQSSSHGFGFAHSAYTGPPISHDLDRDNTAISEPVMHASSSLYIFDSTATANTEPASSGYSHAELLLAPPQRLTQLYHDAAMPTNTETSNGLEPAKCNYCERRFTGQYARGNLMRHKAMKHAIDGTLRCTLLPTLQSPVPSRKAL